MKRKFEVVPIGYFNSCFKQKTGCPRQSQLVKKAKGKILINYGSNPRDLIDNLSEFSHIWILFIFHKNFHFSMSKDNNKVKFYKNKIKPPRCDKRVGILSSRSPYRPNSIGMSIAKIERIDKKLPIIYVSGCDLIDSTPVIDVKPYIKKYDSIQTSVVPKWIENNNINEKIKVIFTKDSKKQLIDLVLNEKYLEYYDNVEDVVEMITSVIKLEPRSKYRKEEKSNEVFGFFMDKINIRCLYLNKNDCFVIEIEKIEKTKSFTKSELKVRNTEEAKIYINMNEKDLHKIIDTF